LALDCLRSAQPEAAGAFIPDKRRQTINIAELMNAPAYVADPAGNSPLLPLSPGGSSVNPKEHVEPGTNTAVVLGFFALGLGVLIGGLFTYGILWFVLIIAPIAHYFNRKKAIAALKGSAVEVSEAQLPEIHQCAVTLPGRLGMASAPKVYILEADTINAAAVKLAGKKVVVLQDDMVDACQRSGDARTLTFIIDHEMAHHALGNTGIFRSGLSKAFKKLSRLDEFSCDAAANALVADPKISSRAITLLTVGPQLMSYVNFESLMRQAQELNLDKHSKKAERHLTHPLLLRRLSRFVS
jgi:Zn-dependent protease with chaperone function